MKTKQLRLSDPKQIRSRISSLVGKKVNLVLRDQTVQTGTLTSAKDSSIALTNMRLKKIIFQLDSISEIYLDTIV